MGLFNLFKKKKNQQPENTDEVFNRILLTVCGNNSNAAAELKSLNENVRDFAKTHPEYYEGWLTDSDDSEESLKRIGWIEILAKYGCAAMFDHSCDLEDFAYFTNGLVTVQSEKLGFSQEKLDGDGDITRWSEQLDEMWCEKGFCLGCIDIDSDSYLVFPIEISTLERLRELAKSINRRIDYAKNC
ncbi:DUF6630 family protein [Ruminococcus sp. Marseille-P6503]|uniref:DUF6630 family protein n=1 Tax=Ruminococcus sp. Marseille-P6503 TaxID=2364796 RepID=UPI000F521AD9|nr:DUF6630 family protein [Ruminococcus sp. Marseille-P6503]